MRVKKRVKRGVKKGIKRVKSAPPGPYLAGVGVLVGGAAVLLLATTKTGQELLIRTAQLALHPDADRQEESEEQEGEHNEPAGDTDVEEEPEDDTAGDDEDTAGDDESQVANLEPRSRRPRSRAPLRHATKA